MSIIAQTLITFGSSLTMTSYLSVLAVPVLPLILMIILPTISLILQDNLTQGSLNLFVGFVGYHLTQIIYSVTDIVYLILGFVKLLTRTLFLKAVAAFPVCEYARRQHLLELLSSRGVFDQETHTWNSTIPDCFYGTNASNFLTVFDYNRDYNNDDQQYSQSFESTRSIYVSCDVPSIHVIIDDVGLSQHEYYVNKCHSDFIGYYQYLSLCLCYIWTLFGLVAFSYYKLFVYLNVHRQRGLFDATITGDVDPIKIHTDQNGITGGNGGGNGNRQSNGDGNGQSITNLTNEHGLGGSRSNQPVQQQRTNIGGPEGTKSSNDERIINTGRIPNVTAKMHGFATASTRESKITTSTNRLRVASGSNVESGGSSKIPDDQSSGARSRSGEGVSTTSFEGSDFPNDEFDPTDNEQPTCKQQPIGSLIKEAMIASSMMYAVGPGKNSKAFPGAFYIATEDDFVGFAVRTQEAAFITAEHVWAAAERYDDIKKVSYVWAAPLDKPSDRVRLELDEERMQFEQDSNFDIIGLTLIDSSKFSLLSVSKVALGTLPQAGTRLTTILYNKDVLNGVVTPKLTLSMGCLGESNSFFEFKHSASTLPGSSGAPMYHNGKVVGLHVAAGDGFNIMHSTEIIRLTAILLSSYYNGMEIESDYYGKNHRISHGRGKVQNAGGKGGFILDVGTAKMFGQHFVLKGQGYAKPTGTANTATKKKKALEIKDVQVTHRVSKTISPNDVIDIKVIEDPNYVYIVPDPNNQTATISFAPIDLDIKSGVEINDPIEVRIAKRKEALLKDVLDGKTLDPQEPIGEHKTATGKPLNLGNVLINEGITVNDLTSISVAHKSGMIILPNTLNGKQFLKIVRTFKNGRDVKEKISNVNSYLTQINSNLAKEGSDTRLYKLLISVADSDLESKNVICETIGREVDLVKESNPDIKLLSPPPIPANFQQQKENCTQTKEEIDMSSLTAFMNSLTQNQQSMNLLITNLLQKSDGFRVKLPKEKQNQKREVKTSKGSKKTSSKKAEKISLNPSNNTSGQEGVLKQN